MAIKVAAQLRLIMLVCWSFAFLGVASVLWYRNVRATKNVGPRLTVVDTAEAGVWYALLPDGVAYSVNGTRCLTVGRPGIELGGVFSPVPLRTSSRHAELPPATGVKRMRGTSLLFHRFYPVNWGHGLLDEFYPAWLSACKLGACHEREPMRGVVLRNYNSRSPPHNKPEGLPIERDLAAFLMMGLEYEALWPQDQWLVFDEVAVGAGSMSLSSPSTNYLMDTGRDSDALRRFRDRFYLSHGLQLPTPRGSLPPNRTLRVTLVQNKRHYTHPGTLDDAVRRLRGRRYDARKLDFSELRSLRQQMQLYSDTDVLVTCVGTGATPTFLLPDGAAVVVVGSFHNAHGTFGYVEEPMFRSLYYLRVLYTGVDGISPLETRLVGFVAQAKEIVVRGFKVPVDVNDNSSPMGIAAEYYTSRDPSLLQVVVGDFASKSMTPMVTQHARLQNSSGRRVMRLQSSRLRPTVLIAPGRAVQREQMSSRVPLVLLALASLCLASDRFVISAKADGHIVFLSSRRCDSWEASHQPGRSDGVCAISFQRGIDNYPRGSAQRETDTWRVKAVGAGGLWTLSREPDIPMGKEVRIITSRNTYLQTNNKNELKHFGKTSESDPRTRWIIERSGSDNVCIKNVGTGLYMMTPDSGVETWWDHCDADRAAWTLRFNGVDDGRRGAWSIWSVHRSRYLIAYGDDENRVNVNREVADTWEHFTISPV
eukprot:m51a1_g1052 hypothetical protein (707) ;mRNA; r:760552-781514